MKTLTFLLFTFSAIALATENFRAPAVLDGSCNLNISLSYEVVVDGKKIKKDKTVEAVQKEQCAEVKKCMNSAEEEEMADLKKLAAVACQNKITPVTTKVPGLKPSKEFDGKRQEKPLDENGFEGTRPNGNTITR